MTRFIYALFVLAIACENQKEIDPSREYTPTELTKRASVPCRQTASWEGQPVTVVGQIDQLNVFPEGPTGKFWLKDAGTANGAAQRIEVYVRNATEAQAAQLFSTVRGAGAATVVVTGKAVATEMPTQARCRKGIQLEISTTSQLTLR